MKFNPLEHPVCLEFPVWLEETAWAGHIPFAMFLVSALRPRTFVELGAYRGVSYCAFCQAVKSLKIETKCYAIDTWQGDEHAGQLEESDPEELLGTIEKRMKAAPFRTQEPMNYCLVKIAVDYPKLRTRAIAIGNKLEVLKDYPVPKGCTSPFAPIWIAYILEHQK